VIPSGSPADDSVCRCLLCSSAWQLCVQPWLGLLTGLHTGQPYRRKTCARKFIRQISCSNPHQDFLDGCKYLSAFCAQTEDSLQGAKSC